LRQRQHAYYGKPLRDVTVDEAAMLAGLPKAPSAFNPISNPKRARARQLYIIDRMLENGFITDEKTALHWRRMRSGTYTDLLTASNVFAATTRLR
jgi:penicillin-binding protein 1A